MRRKMQANWILDFYVIWSQDPPPDMVCLWFYRGEPARPPLVCSLMDDNFPIESYKERFYAWCMCPYPPENFSEHHNVPLEEQKSKK